jgi:tRNA (guanosine-2'-O-)-methyltransferase
MPDDLLQFLAGFVSPRRRRRLERVLDHRTRHLAVVLEDINHPHNAGACLRTCDGLGVQDVHVIENTTRFSVGRKVELGAAQWLTIVRHNSAVNNTLACFETLRRDGYRVVALAPRADESVYDYDIRARTALVFGNELKGLTASAAENVDGLLSIPMFGFTESFNISVSVAIALSTLATRLRRLDIAWELSGDERRSLWGDWIRAALGPKAEALERAFHKRTAGERAPGM